MQQLRGRLRRGWKERSEGNSEFALLGRAARVVRAGEHPAGSSSPGTGPQGRRAGEGRSGAGGVTELLKMAARKANNIAHLPRETRAARGWRTGARATQRNHGETFQPEPTAERKDSASGPRTRERLSTPAGAIARPGLADPSGAVVGAISKSLQEVSGSPYPASLLGALLPSGAPPPAPPRRRLPRRSRPAPEAVRSRALRLFCVAVARRALPGGVEPAAAAPGGRSGGCC